MSRRRSSFTHPFGRPSPAQGVAPLPRRNSITKMVHSVQDWLAPGPIIGKTRAVELVEQTRELSFGYVKQGMTSYEKVEALEEGNEVKWTKPVKLRDPKHWQPRDTKTHRFPNEARVLGLTLKAHRNIVQMLEIVKDATTPGRYFLWMEHCAGGDLDSQVMHWWVKKRAPVPERFLLHVFISLADGLAFLHHGLRSRGNGRYTEDEYHNSVIHGDLHSRNIFLRWTESSPGGMPEVVIGDFGTSKVVEAFAAVDPGRIDMHAPEDVAIHQNSPTTNLDVWLKMVNARTTASDIYAFGQIMYQLAAKERNPCEIGIDPGDLSISREYDTQGLLETIQKCFIVKSDLRAEASFRDGIGIMPVVNRFRTAREMIVSRSMPLDRLEWNRPKPE